MRSGGGSRNTISSADASGTSTTWAAGTGSSTGRPSASREASPFLLPHLPDGGARLRPVGRDERVSARAPAGACGPRGPDGRAHPGERGGGGDLSPVSRRPHLPPPMRVAGSPIPRIGVRSAPPVRTEGKRTSGRGGGGIRSRLRPLLDVGDRVPRSGVGPATVHVPHRGGAKDGPRRRTPGPLGHP